MKICPNCGTSVSDDATFCNNCGAALGDVQPLINKKPGAAPAAAAAPTGQPAQPGVQQAAFNQQSGAAPAGQGSQPVYQQPYMTYDPKDHTAEFDPKDIAENKLFAVIPYVSLLLGLIAGIYVGDSKFVKFHIKNAIRLEVAMVIVALLFIIPFLGWIAGGILIAILFVVEIIGIVNAFQGKAKELPILSSIGFLK